MRADLEKKLREFCADTSIPASKREDATDEFVEKLFEEQYPLGCTTKEMDEFFDRVDQIMDEDDPDEDAA